MLWLVTGEIQNESVTWLCNAKNSDKHGCLFNSGDFYLEVMPVNTWQCSAAAISKLFGLFGPHLGGGGLEHPISVGFC